MQHKSKSLIWPLKKNLLLFSSGQRQYLDFFFLLFIGLSIKKWTFYSFLASKKSLMMLSPNVESATSWTGLQRVGNCLPNWHYNANCLTNCHLNCCPRKIFLSKIFKSFVFFKLTTGVIRSNFPDSAESF